MRTWEGEGGWGICTVLFCWRRKEDRDADVKKLILLSCCRFSGGEYSGGADGVGKGSLTTSWP